MKKIEKWFLDNKKHRILLLLAFICLYFCFYYITKTISMDEIWNYGFAYNITTGLVPYHDFNMILTPLYTYLLATLIFIFGHKFMVMVVFNSILSGITHYLLFKKHGLSSLILMPCLFFISYTCYNSLSLLLLIILINVKETKRSEYLVGFIVSLMLLTKQTVGGVILIVSFILSKNKKQYLIGFLPLCVIFMGYLIITNSVYQFFDYCLFGMFDFTSGNSFSMFNFSLIFYLLAFGFLLYLNIKKKFKDTELLYILLFQVMAIPLFDYVHTLIAIIPFMAYLLNHKISKKKEKYLGVGILSFYIFASLFSIIVLDFDEYKDTYYLNDSFLQGKRVGIDFKYMYDLNKYFNDNFSDYKIYHLDAYAYLYKLVNNEKINKYDLNNKGNMGYHGDQRYIDEIKNDCQDKKCLLVIDDANIKGQISKTIQNYVIENYTYYDSLHGVSLYTNDN